MNYLLIILIGVLWNRIATRRADAMMEANIQYLIDTHSADLQRMKEQRDKAEEALVTVLLEQARAEAKRRESALRGWETRRTR